MLGQIQITYSKWNKKPTNKIRKIDKIESNKAKMAYKMVYESIRNTTSQSKSGI